MHINNCKFSETPIFSNSTFSGLFTSFIDNEFDTALFLNTKFATQLVFAKNSFLFVRFCGSRFTFSQTLVPNKGYLDFRGCRFSKEVSFQLFDFLKGVNFECCYFKDKTKFSGSNFYSNTSFKECKFNDLVDFSDCVFDCEVDFSEARFNKKALFHYAEFCSPKSVLTFKNADFTNADFTQLDLSGMDLSNACVKNIKFDKESSFIGINASTCWGNMRFRRFAMDQAYIEELREKKNVYMSIFAIEIIGRFFSRLKGYFLNETLLPEENKMQQNRGGATKRFKKIFEIYNKEKQKSFSFWLWFWRVSSDYGRNIWRWIICSVIFVFLFAAIFYVLGENAFNINATGCESVTLDVGPTISSSKNADVSIIELKGCKGLGFGRFTMLYYSVVTFTTLGFGDVTPLNKIAAFFILLEVIVGYIMLGGLISILANKLAKRAD